jgi:FlaA1/EpsC-like NDP-sugar epimerase
VQIHFTGLRPGEKLHETLFDELEQRLPTVNPAITATRHPRLPDDFANSLQLLNAAAADGDDDRVRALLGELVPGYRPAAKPEATTAMAMAMASPYPDEF